AVIGALLRAEDRRLRSSALASWALLLPLAVVFDWLEQPPFTLAVMLITGLALRGESSFDPAPSARRLAAHQPIPPGTASLPALPNQEPMAGNVEEL
ncbi:MAG: hypothetical protein ACRDPA_24885, partial [Solirubrobacteraceae bacterium]